MNWEIKDEVFVPDLITNNGNKFLIGNGYLGIRGTLDEFKKNEFVAVNLAGIYDQVGDAWREPLNAPNGLYTHIEFNGMKYGLPEVEPASHNLSLNYRHGILSRATTWSTPTGLLKVTSERFASMADKHLIVMKYSIRVDNKGVLKIVTGIDGDVWDINGPHYDDVLLQDDSDYLSAIGITHENKDLVCVKETIEKNFHTAEKVIKTGRKILREFTLDVLPEHEYTFYKWVSVYTSKDDGDYGNLTYELITKAKIFGFEHCKRDHVNEWEKKWKISEVVIEGDEEAMEALNYSTYHLHSIAPRHTDSLSIAARGLSGQTYKGAVFWDTEMFMLDFFLFTEPNVAKTLLKYRIDTLPGAIKKAADYGYQGAFYAWESQEGGFDACSDYNVTDVFTGRKMRTYFKDKQIHISAAVVYGIMRYVNFTGNYELILNGGAEVILECAAFYYDLLVKKVHLDQYELLDVIGPDEYHERVNNNAYTNRMAKYTFESAIGVLKLLLDSDDVSNLKENNGTIKENLKDIYESLSDKYDLNNLLTKYQDAANKIYIPEPNRQTGVIEQFDGYEQLEEVSLEELKTRLLHEKEYWGGAYGIATHTKIIKQADVVTMLNLFSQEYEPNVLLTNWKYYEPRTEHGSSLSACMYAMLACKCNMPDIAYPLFLKSAMADLSGGGKQWAGLIYIGGTHPAASGGAYMTAVEGFAGVHIEDGEIKADAKLPSNWKSMKCNVIYHGDLYEIKVTHENTEINNLGQI
ncbi:MAG: Kojibiose phosphorylase [Anaerocolumna sp.]|nr:Kojibiose phosphorylase [Anaerocolumna sp.]